MSDCYDQWQKLKKDYDYLAVSVSINGTGDVMTAQPGMFEYEDDCRYSCTGGSCVFYQYNGVSKTCSTYLAPEGAAADPNMKMAMKMDEGYYAVYSANAAAKASIGDAIPITVDGSLVTSVVTSSVSGCVKRCDEVEGCVALFVTMPIDGGSSHSCELRSGALSAELKSKYRIADGSNINRWK